MQQGIYILLMSSVNPAWFREPDLFDFISVLFLLILPFLIPYLYVRFFERSIFESRAASFARDRLVPFIMYRLHLKKLIAPVKRVLGARILSPRAISLIRTALHRLTQRV